MTALKSLLIETQVDKLIKLVRRRGKVTVSQAAIALGVDERKIEEWVNILEEHGFVELRYPAIGEPEILLKEFPAEKIEKKGEEFERRKEKIEEKAKKYEKKVSEVKEKVEISDKEFLELQEELHRKLGNVEKGFLKLREYEKRGKRILEEAEEIEEISKKYTEHFQSAKNTLKEMDKKINEHLKRIKDHGIDVKSLEKSRILIENEIKALGKEMKILRSLARRPLSIPLLSALKRSFKTHRKRGRKIGKKKKKLKRKVLKVKKIIKKRKRRVKRRKLKHKKKYKVKKRRIKRRKYEKKPKKKKRKIKRRKLYHKKRHKKKRKRRKRFRIRSIR